MYIENERTLHNDIYTVKTINSTIYSLYDYLAIYEDEFDKIPEVNQNMIIDAINMRMQELGENIKKLSNEFIEMYGGYFNAYAIIRTRNLISHTYNSVNPRIIRDIINNELPSIEEAIHVFEEYYAIAYAEGE